MHINPQENMDKLKFYLENVPSVKIEISGHTDNSGTESFNRNLGSLRADFVKSFLVKAGITSDRILTVSKSFSQPAAPNESVEGRAKNRRTEIKILI